MESCHCEHVQHLLEVEAFRTAALRFIAAATPIILGIAMFVVAVMK